LFVGSLLVTTYLSSSSSFSVQFVLNYKKYFRILLLKDE